MAEVVLHPDPSQFPPGTKLKVYAVSQPERAGITSGGAPPGAMLSEPEVSPAGTLTVTGLEEGARYVGWAATPDRYLRFQAGGSGGGLAVLGGDGTIGGSGGSPLSPLVVSGRPVLYGKDGLRRFRALAADAIYKVVPIVVGGHSIPAGQGGDNNTGAYSNVPDNAQGWVGQLRQMLAASPHSGAQNPGEGFWATDDSRLTQEGTGNNNWSCVPLGHGYRLIKNTQKIKLAAVPAGVTKIGVIQSNADKAFNEAGSKLADVTGAYKVGAGAETALTALTNTRVPVEQQVAVTAGEAFEVFGPATAQTYIAGLSMYTAATGGFAVHRVCQPGYVSGDLLGRQKLGALLQVASPENQVFAARSVYRWAGASGLLILEFGTNDQAFQVAGGSENQRGVTLALYTAWMQQAAAQAVADGWCVLIVGDPRNPAGEASGAGTHSMSEYAAAMKAFALSTDHVAFMDIGELWGAHAAAEALGLTAVGTVHPTRAGHGDIARMVYRAILGDAPVGVAELEAA